MKVREVDGQEGRQKESVPPSIDHIGWRLWCASQTWKEQFVAGMLASGHHWYAEARSSIIPYLDREGTRQGVLVQRMGLSKQAVQQLIDDLEREGIVERRPDPEDRRGKIVAFTPKGLKAQSDANEVKRDVEATFRAKLGPEDFDRFDDLLRRLAYE